MLIASRFSPDNARSGIVRAARQTIRSAMAIPMAIFGALAGGVLAPTTVFAQTSREVVQPLPAAGAAELNTALQRLSRNSRDVSALIDAGKASLQLDDIDAAIGFFGRADELAPNMPEVKQGLAAAFVRSERPIQALRLFAEAEAAGAQGTLLAADRGLAYDLVGANSHAREQYGIALARKRDPEITRRLALSHAIAGDRKAFDETLRAQLNRREYAAYRTRAFGLAILGDGDEAVAIADAVMPKALADQITPYLRFMPRLSAAQQAAAANLGIFPRAAQIGRDDPQIAAYRAELRGGMRITDAGNALAPTGRPLGPRARNDATSGRRRPGQDAAVLAANTVAKPNAAATAAQVPARAVAVVENAPAAGAEPQPELAPESPPESPSELAPQSVPVPETESEPAPPSLPAPSSLPEVAKGAKVEGQPEEVAVARPSVDLVQAAAPSKGQSSSSSSFNLANLSGTQPGAQLEAGAGNPSVVQPDTGSKPLPVTEPTPTPEPRKSVADAFASLAVPKTVTIAPGSGAVDITRIAIPREKEREAGEEDAPPAPEHPSRIWVQVATGKDRDALRFDWRRISRKAADALADRKGYTAPWNATNRLVTGPFETMSAARDTINALADAGVDSFAFRSEKGQEISLLP